MDVRDNLKYTKEHEWVRVNGKKAVIGITDYAQSELGDIVYVELPPAGTPVKKMEPFGTVEAVKTVSDLFSPVTGTISTVNERIKVNAGIVNQDPYGEGWMIGIDMADAGELNDLLSPDQYRQRIGG